MKFNPEITKIKLNPEQAVLTCTCVKARYQVTASARNRVSICTRRSNTSRTARVTQYCTGAAQNDTT